MEDFEAMSDDHSRAYMLYRVTMELKKTVRLEDPKPKQKKRRSTKSI
jgi:hypothetical protein